MIRFAVNSDANGNEYASTDEWDGYRGKWSRHGAVCALARELVALGCPDQPWCVPGRMHGRSLHKLAKLTVREAKQSSGVHFRRWLPMTEERLHDARTPRQSC